MRKKFKKFQILQSPFLQSGLIPILILVLLILIGIFVNSAMTINHSFVQNDKAREVHQLVEKIAYSNVATKNDPDCILQLKKGPEKQLKKGPINYRI